ncbi:hypothetical protein Pint_36462 [Pistacia integerrima]|uniref:Uncharacterized protein n=1 Tax=Pistacia integerrima TaxID=434235 RepID=A0ACC0Y1I3_9ROSI|nr:hypothetical protein Pint_36462 [Pistacia integerrima]
MPAIGVRPWRRWFLLAVRVSCLLAMWRCEDCSASRGVFEKPSGERDQATWNAMILGYTQNGLVEEAFITFRRCLSERVVLVVIFGLVNEGLQIFELIESKYKIQPSTEHYCCVVDMLDFMENLIGRSCCQEVA